MNETSLLILYAVSIHSVRVTFHVAMFPLVIKSHCPVMVTVEVLKQ